MCAVYIYFLFIFYAEGTKQIVDNVDSATSYEIDAHGVQGQYDNIKVQGQEEIPVSELEDPVEIESYGFGISNIPKDIKTEKFYNPNTQESIIQNIRITKIPQIPEENSIINKGEEIADTFANTFVSELIHHDNEILQNDEDTPLKNLNESVISKPKENNSVPKNVNNTDRPSFVKDDVLDHLPSIVHYYERLLSEDEPIKTFSSLEEKRLLEDEIPMDSVSLGEEGRLLLEDEIPMETDSLPKKKRVLLQIEMPMETVSPSEIILENTYSWDDDHNKSFLEKLRPIDTNKMIDTNIEKESIPNFEQTISNEIVLDKELSIISKIEDNLKKTNNKIEQAINKELFIVSNMENKKDNIFDNNTQEDKKKFLEMHRNYNSFNPSILEDNNIFDNNTQEDIDKKFFLEMHHNDFDNNNDKNFLQIHRIQHSSNQHYRPPMLNKLNLYEDLNNNEESNMHHSNDISNILDNNNISEEDPFSKSYSKEVHDENFISLERLLEDEIERNKQFSIYNKQRNYDDTVGLPEKENNNYNELENYPRRHMIESPRAPLVHELNNEEDVGETHKHYQSDPHLKSNVSVGEVHLHPSNVDPNMYFNHSRELRAHKKKEKENYWHTPESMNMIPEVLLQAFGDKFSEKKKNPHAEESHSKNGKSRLLTRELPTNNNHRSFWSYLNLANFR